MGFRKDDRGISAVLGAVLLLLIVVLLFSTLQTTGVPNWNRAVEFQHNQRVQDDMEALRAAIVATAADGNERSQVVELGTTYPRRIVLQNPGDPRGTIETGTTGTLSITDATATGEAGDYWDGSRVEFTTRPVVYTPSYNFYDDAPTTVYEVGILYNRFESANLTLTDQDVVDGNRITLRTVNGSLREQGTTGEAIDTTPASAPMRAITVEDGSGPITIEIPTRLPNATWADALEDEYVANGGHVTDQSYVEGSPHDTLVLTLERGVAYELRMARVGVGAAVEDPGAHYVVNVTGGGEEITVDEDHELVVEVRDGFNNPVSNAVVNASVVDGDGTVAPTQARTDEAGRATFTFSSPNETTATIEANVSADPLEREKVNFTVTVSEPGGNPVQLAGIRFDGASRQGSRIDLAFNNTIEEDRDITDFRMVFYQGGNPDSGTIEGQSFTVGGPSIDLDPDLTIPAGATSTFTVEFDTYNPNSGDWFVFTVTYDTGQTAQYFGTI